MPDKTDRLLAAGATFDWISPLVSLVQDITNGPGHIFFVDLYAGYSINDIKGLLRGHGVKVWGDMIVDNMIAVTVRKKQAHWAQYLLEREGVPLLAGQLATPENRSHRSGLPTMPQRRDTPGLMTRIDRWLDTLFS
jgi:hypothetical protein